MERAYFIKYPRVLEDLTVPHLLDAEREYEIVGTVSLPAIDYENFITDMAVDREFLEKDAGLCAEGVPMKCLRIKRRGAQDGVLVVTEDESYVKWAAYLQ